MTKAAFLAVITSILVLTPQSAHSVGVDSKWALYGDLGLTSYQLATQKKHPSESGKPFANLIPRASFSAPLLIGDGPFIFLPILGYAGGDSPGHFTSALNLGFGFKAGGARFSLTLGPGMQFLVGHTVWGTFYSWNSCMDLRWSRWRLSLGTYTTRLDRPALRATSLYVTGGYAFF